MAAGGIRDQLGGGFAGTPPTSVWLVPHFEKMLYDNAQLALAYLHAWQVTGADRHAQVVRETLAFMARDLLVTDPTGLVGLAASLDADTEGEEGSTYVWTADEVQSVLGPDAPQFAAAYGVTDGGNWEGRTILSRVRDDAALATTWAISREEVASRLGRARTRLLEARDARPQPARDDKVIASWNGLALAAFAEAGRVLPDAETMHDWRPSSRPHWSVGFAPPAAGCTDRGRTADRVLQPCSRTTPTSLRDCWRCTRPRSMTAGSGGRPSSWMSPSRTSLTPTVVSTTPPTTPVACSPVRAASSTARCRPAMRWP